MSRRGQRTSRRGIGTAVSTGGGPAPPPPLELDGEVATVGIPTASNGEFFDPTHVPSLIAFWFADDASNMSLSGADVISWTDQTGAHVLTDNSVLTQRPDTSSTLNGRTVVNFDGLLEWLLCTTINRPAPATTPTIYWGVVVPDTSAQFEQIVHCGSSAANHMAWYYANTSQSLQMNNGTAANAITLVAASGNRVLTSFTGSTSDSHQLNDDAAVTGANAGNNDPATDFHMGSRAGAASTFYDGKVACFGMYSAAPSSADKTRLSGWSKAVYGV